MLNYDDLYGRRAAPATPATQLLSALAAASGSGSGTSRTSRAATPAVAARSEQDKPCESEAIDLGPITRDQPGPHLRGVWTPDGFQAWITGTSRRGYFRFGPDSHKPHLYHDLADGQPRTGVLVGSRLMAGYERPWIQVSFERDNPSAGFLRVPVPAQSPSSTTTAGRGGRSSSPTAGGGRASAQSGGQAAPSPATSLGIITAPFRGPDVRPGDAVAAYWQEPEGLQIRVASVVGRHRARLVFKGGASGGIHEWALGLKREEATISLQELMKICDKVSSRRGPLTLRALRDDSSTSEPLDLTPLLLALESAPPADPSSSRSSDVSHLPRLPDDGILTRFALPPASPRGGQMAEIRASLVSDGRTVVLSLAAYEEKATLRLLRTDLRVDKRPYDMSQGRSAAVWWIPLGWLRTHSEVEVALDCGATHRVTIPWTTADNKVVGSRPGEPDAGGSLPVSHGPASLSNGAFTLFNGIQVHDLGNFGGGPDARKLLGFWTETGLNLWTGTLIQDSRKDIISSAVISTGTGDLTNLLHDKPPVAEITIPRRDLDRAYMVSVQITSGEHLHFLPDGRDPWRKPTPTRGEALRPLEAPSISAEQIPAGTILPTVLSPPESMSQESRGFRYREWPSPPASGHVYRSAEDLRRLSKTDVALRKSDVTLTELVSRARRLPIEDSSLDLLALWIPEGLLLTAVHSGTTQITGAVYRLVGDGGTLHLEGENQELVEVLVPRDALGEARRIVLDAGAQGGGSIAVAALPPDAWAETPAAIEVDVPGVLTGRQVEAVARAQVRAAVASGSDTYLASLRAMPTTQRTAEFSARDRGKIGVWTRLSAHWTEAGLVANFHNNPGRPVFWAAGNGRFWPIGLGQSGQEIMIPRAFLKGHSHVRGQISGGGPEIRINLSEVPDPWPSGSDTSS